MPENTTSNGDMPFFGEDEHATEAAGPTVPDESPTPSDEQNEAPSRGRRNKRSMLMGALGLGHGGSESVSDEAPTPEAEAATSPSSDTNESKRPRRSRPKKPNERLESVINESVPGSAISLLQTCKAFEYAPGIFAALMLDTDEIGGLNKKSANDPDKGTIIHAMTNDRISIIATREMLDDDKLMIIPTHDSISMMEEFGLLVKAKYIWGLVDANVNGAVSLEEKGPATFEECRDIALGVVSVQSVIDSHRTSTPTQSNENVEPQAQTEQSAAPSNIAPSTQTSNPTPAVSAPVMPAAPAVTPSAPDDDDLAGDNDLLLPPDDIEAGLVYPDDEDEDVVDLDELDDDVEGVYDDDEVSIEEVQAAIERRFHDERLGFELTTEDFENYVDSTIEFTPFLSTETRGSSWLQDVVAAHVDAANAEIGALHEQHIITARQIYIDIISNGIAQINDDTSLDDPQTQFGRLKKLLDDEARNDREKVDLAANEEIKRLREEFERGMDLAGSAAAESAKNRYYEDNHPRLDREMKEIPERVASRISETRKDRLDTIVQDRRAVARGHVDTLISEALQSMSELFDKQRAAEIEVARRWSETITKTVDEHLKDDVARAQTLAEDLERTNRIEALAAAHRDELEAKSAEYRRVTAEMNQQLVETQQAAESSLEGLRASLQARIDEAEGNARAGRERVEALESQLATIVERETERRESEVRAVSEARAAEITEFNARWDSAMMVRRLICIVAVAIAILLAVAGYVVGVRMGQSAFIDISSMRNMIDLR